MTNKIKEHFFKFESPSKMYELINLSGNSWYIKSPTNVGLFKDENNDVILIDSGNGDDAARKILSTIQSNGWNLKMIVNTHSNGDHIGGNALLQKRTGCRIATTRQEATFVTDPILEPSFLLGAYPNSKLRNRFLEAQSSNVTDVISPELSNGQIGETGLQAIPLPGHFMGMIGVLTPDKVLYTADSFFSEHVLNKYHITFIYDVKSFLQTLDMLEKFDANHFVPSHAEPVSDIKPLVITNRNKINEIIDLILKFCAEPINFEDLLKKLLDHYSIMLDFNQYVLIGSTTKSYLSYLYDLKKIDAIFDDNLLRWKRI